MACRLQPQTLAKVRERPFLLSFICTKSVGRSPTGLGSDSIIASESVIRRSVLQVFMARLPASRGIRPMPVTSTSPSVRNRSEERRVGKVARYRAQLEKAAQEPRTVERLRLVK